MSRPPVTFSPGIPEEAEDQSRIIPPPLPGERYVHRDRQGLPASSGRLRRANDRQGGRGRTARTTLIKEGEHRG